MTRRTRRYRPAPIWNIGRNLITHTVFFQTEDTFIAAEDTNPNRNNSADIIRISMHRDIRLTMTETVKIKKINLLSAPYQGQGKLKNNT